MAPGGEATGTALEYSSAGGNVACGGPAGGLDAAALAVPVPASSSAAAAAATAALSRAVILPRGAIALVPSWAPPW
ncbi:hypothetical protein GCM10027047_15510 [Rhodococcus aerolatus]